MTITEKSEREESLVEKTRRAADHGLAYMKLRVEM